MFGSIDIKTRPLRMAYLVDPGNPKQVREAIQLSSTLWGGDFSPIIPLHKKMPFTWREKPFKTPSAKSVILGYIEAFDPDIIVQLSEDIPKFITDIGIKIIKPAIIWEALENGKSFYPKYGIGVFELFENIFEQYFKFKMKYPFQVVFPRIPEEYSLFWASLFGEIPTKILSPLEKHYQNPLEIKKQDLKVDDIKQLLSGKSLFPLRITRHGINKYHQSSFGRDACAYYLDATKTEDVIDFWNLRAMGKAVMPIPEQLKDDPNIKELIISFLKAHRRPWEHNPKVCDYASIIKARNCTTEKLKEYAKTLKIEHTPIDTSDSPFFSIQNWYPRIWDEWARDKDGALPTEIYGEDEDSVEVTDSEPFRIRFKPLLPKFAPDWGYHSGIRCANEINFRFYGSKEYIAEVYPKSFGENYLRTISGMGSFGDWRIGRNGLVKLVRKDFNETMEMPLAEKVVSAWLADLGWKNELSSAGLLAKQIYLKLNGHISVLRNEKLLGFLEYMNGGSVRQDGTPIEDNKIFQERCVPVREVKSRLASISKMINLHDYLVERGIFKLGLKVQCSHCSRNSWFSLENTHDVLTCPRCLNVFPAVGNIDNSVWCYKTAGPFSVPGYAEGGYAVLLTLDCFSERNIHARITPILSFNAETSGKLKIEADLAAFWQESAYGTKRNGLLFGECKTYGYFKKEDFDRIRYLAKTFPGTILVFSTLRKSLTGKEIAQISRIAKAGRKYWKAERSINPVLILTGNELLSHFGPPDCWEKAVEKKFGHISGLLDLCDATQQIYLNLPPLRNEWFNKLEKKQRDKQSPGEIVKSDISAESSN